MKTDNERLLLVAALTNRRFVDFCRTHDLSPSPSGKTVKWIRHADDLRGRRDDWLIILNPEMTDDVHFRAAIVIGEFVIVEYEEPQYIGFVFPKVTATRGGIRYPTPEKRELEGTFI